MAPPISNYRVCANARLKCSKTLMSAQQPFVALASCSESWCVQTLRMENKDPIVTENPVRCKYACARALLCMPVSKRRRNNTCKIQKPLALAGLHFFCRKKASR